MRFGDPLIVGAGPAGCAAAITLARGGARPVVIDRSANAGDALCGGYLSAETAQRLRDLGCDPAAHGARPIDRLVLFGPGTPVERTLPRPAWALSRRALDSRLRALALAAGAELVIDTVREIDGLTVRSAARSWDADSLFLGTGKHDVRGHPRPRPAADPALGLRLRLAPSPALARLLDRRIELHLFDRGYAGIVLQEDGSANVCLAVRKSQLAQSGGDPHLLLAALGAAHPAFARRLEPGWEDASIDTIGSVPYGHLARAAGPGLFRLGDQAAVIPSLAGEGIGIAITSGIRAAEAWLGDGADAAPRFQADLRASAARRVALAGILWALLERPALARPALAAARRVPAIIDRAVSATRIA